MRSLLLSIPILLFTFPAIPTAHAASFDCGKAAKPDEIAICSTPELSELDSEMGALWFTYSRLPFLMGMSGERRDAAEEFLEEREKCGNDTACLRSLYDSRIEALRNGIAGWLQQTASEMGVGGNASPWSAATVPSPVSAIIEGYAEECASLDGTLEEGADAPLIMTADLDGDGLQDFLVNPQNMQCSAAASLYCGGSGGCKMTLALSGKNYGDPVDILGGGPALSQDENGGAVLEIWTHATNCDGAAPAASCLARYSWTNGKLDTTYEVAQPRE